MPWRGAQFSFAMWAYGAALLGWLAVLAPRDAAAEILDLQVHREAERFAVSFAVRLHAAPAEVRLLMDQPQLWPRYSTVVASADLLEAHDDSQLVAMVFRQCILWWCKNIRKTTEFRVDPSGDVVGVALPERSDFRYARERWRLTPEGDDTRVEVEAEFVPAFRVPPLIGSLLVRSSLKRLLTEMERNVEAQAAGTVAGR